MRARAQGRLFGSNVVEVDDVVAGEMLGLEGVYPAVKVDGQVAQRFEVVEQRVVVRLGLIDRRRRGLSYGEPS